MRPDVAQSARAEQGIHQRVHHDISVRVAVEALRILMLGTSDTTLPPLPDY